MSPGMWRRRCAIAGFVLATVAGTAVNSMESRPGTQMVVHLVLPRAPAKDEAVNAEFRVGTLPRGARIVVRTDDGELCGTITPFGAQAAATGGLYMIPLPARAAKDGKFELRLELEQKGTEVRRAPSDEEIKSVRLVLVHITN